MSATRIPAAIDNTSGGRARRRGARACTVHGHVLRLHGQHDDIGAVDDLAVVGRHVHAQFVGERDTARLHGFADLIFRAAGRAR